MRDFFSLSCAMLLAGACLLGLSSCSRNEAFGPTFEATELVPVFALPSKNAELSTHYEQLKNKLESRHPDLELHCVLGRANAQYLRVGPELWTERPELNNFSNADAFGRMLCPEHPRNPTSKYLIVLRADDLGDTLLHEYMHYIQSKRKNSALCQLYTDLEASPTEELREKNAAHEYEVYRFILEHADDLKLGPDALMQSFDRLSNLNLQSVHVAEIDKRYEWKSGDDFVKSNKGKILTITEDYVSTHPLQRNAYILSEVDSQSISHKDREKTRQGQLKKLCLKSGDDAMLTQSFARQLQKWNELIGAEAIVEKCNGFKNVHRIKIILDKDSGAVGDGLLKVFGLYSADTPIEWDYLVQLRVNELREAKIFLSAQTFRQAGALGKIENDAIVDQELFSLLGWLLGFAEGASAEEHSKHIQSLRTSLR